MEIDSRKFGNIINTVQECVFWKDKDRRFVGVNQAFLDFYGFESADILIGKNDEDMGWHSDPEPYKEDELRVLSGESTYKVPGKCIIRGEERDIIASKSPIYDGDEVIGLVGSFIDVTDILRKEQGSTKAQTLYDRNCLRRYPFFDKLLDETGLDEILDSLTGTISREFIIRFARSLIASGTRFTFAILDLDNFKFINDNCGHHIGDRVLMDVTRALADYMREVGVVGRFGGDELLLLNLKDVDYDDKKKFFEGMYDNRKILRKRFAVDGGDLLITGTIGAATYPDDATDYDSLFGIIDKALYRGKTKGRNCYTIYDESRHKDIEVKKLAKNGIYTNMRMTLQKLSKTDGIMDRLRSLLPFLSEQMHIQDLLYVDKDGVLTSAEDETVSKQVGDPGCIIKDGLYNGNTISKIRNALPALFKALESQNIHTVIIVPVGLESEDNGYIICACDRHQRLWQENECALMYFLSKVII